MKKIMQVWQQEYLSVESTYKNHVDKFITFLDLPEIDKLNQPATISKIDVENCVAFYVKEGNIGSIGSLSNHLESIKAFYKYLIKRGYVENNVVPLTTFSDFKEKLAKKHNLKKRVEREWLQDDDIKLILDTMDTYFDSTTYKSLGKEPKERYIYWLCLRVYLKISLIAPAKKSTLIAIKFSDFSNDYRTLKIHEINIKIPNSLRNNIKYTISFVQSIKNRGFENNDRLFEFISGHVGSEKDKTGSKLNNWLCYFLQQNNILDVPGEDTSFPVEVVSNTTLYNMVKNGTNPYYISLISGIGISSLEKKFYKKIESLTYETNALLELNNSIAQCDYYQYI